MTVFYTVNLVQRLPGILHVGTMIAQVRKEILVNESK